MNRITAALDLNFRTEALHSCFPLSQEKKKRTEKAWDFYYTNIVFSQNLYLKLPLRFVFYEYLRFKNCPQLDHCVQERVEEHS